MRLAFVFSPAAFCLSVIGCASTAGIEEEMSRMRRELVAMRKELSDTQLSVQRLEGQVTLLSVGRTPVQKAPETEVARSPSPKSKGSRAARDNRVLPVVRLGNKASEAEQTDEAWIDPGAQDDGSPPLVIKLDDSTEVHEKDRITVDRDVLKKPDPVLSAAKPAAKQEAVKPAEATSADLEAQYQAALTKLRGEGKAGEALELFRAFRDQNPRSNLADNAAYWIGECHVALAAHDKAIAELEALVRDYPKSSKRADAMVRIGESWLALGNEAKAGASFRQVIDSYPKTDAAGRARSRLSTLSLSEGGK
jgi:tol-pal system protein YbgF